MYIITDNGKAAFLNYILNKSIPSTLKLHLYKNSVTLSTSLILSNITENNETGYNAISLLPNNWTVNAGSASFPQQKFSFTAPATIYGYYITDANNTILILINALNDPVVLPSIGGDVLVTPSLSLL